MQEFAESSCCDGSIQAIPRHLELLRDEGMPDVRRVDIEIERALDSQPPLDRDKALATQGRRIKVDDGDSGACRHVDPAISPNIYRVFFVSFE